ncbi:MAG TPA: EAL domain-containing protein [Candidatus Binatia bacterium]|jgi:diguanylate cyclase (GGDEF)-like protein/PAS domain S-box-containing protein|nr:EAL domain-containing protein [Candidatus Binatia bacterium]
MKKMKRGPKLINNRFIASRDQDSNQDLAKQSHYQSLFNSVAFSIVETDLTGRIVDCNPALARMLLASQDDFRACKILSLMPNKWHEKEESTRAEVIDNGVTDEYEIELRKSDGTVFPVAVKKWLQTDERGKAQGIWMLVRDITDKKKNDDVVYQRAILLLENQIRYQSLLASLPIGILTIDKTGRIDTVNPAVEELLAYTSSEIVGKKLEELVTSPSGHPLPITARQAHTAVAKCRNNKILPVQITFSELRTKGQILYTGFLRDITVDVRIRETLQRAHDELEARVREESAEIARLSDALQAEISERTWAQEQFRIAVESAPNGMLIVDQDGNVTLVNAHIEQLFGYNRDELMGRPVEILLPERFRKQAGQQESFFTSPNERWIGRDRELYGLRKDGTEFPVEIGLNPIHKPRGKGVLVAVVDVTERKHVESELKRTAFHDGLTGLPNRTLFLDNLLRLNASAKRHGHHPFALLFLDLDRFKVINDTLGHMVGDKLLIEMAHRLVECTREEDTVARLGGDEFAILLEQIRGPEDAVRVAERTLERLADPLMLDDNEVSVGASIGIALSLTGEKMPEDLLRDADMAMYQAKTRRSGYQIFDAKMHARALERMRLEMDMKRAIERKQIHLHYQPIVSLESGKLAGFEALARWQHNGRGAVSPAEFIPLAEETGLVGPLSSWVFREACRQMRNWQQHFSMDENCYISVNVSSKQVSHGGLINELDEVLHETGLEPQHLRLEITESALIENTRGVAHTLSQLRKRRIKLCLDDFGKGFSSLNYLHRFPIDVLKIDRSFVRRLGAAFPTEHGKRRPYEIIRTILALAQILDLQVVAEGIEVIQQLNVLKELGCQFGQGFLFAPALEATQAVRFFDSAASLSELNA